MASTTATAQATVMRLTAVEGTSDVEQAFARLRERLLQAAQGDAGIVHYAEGACWLVSPNARKPCEAFWFSHDGFWIALEDWHPETYFVSFGTTNPETTKGADGKPELRFLFQGNIKRKGNYRNTAGAFGKGNGTQVYYVHSGRIKKAPRFPQLYNGPRADLTWGRGQSDTRFAVGDLAGEDFVSDLISFVIAVIQFITGGSDPKATDAFYRNTLSAGILAEIQTLASAGAKPGGSGGGTDATSVRLKRLRDLSSWLREDPKLLDPALDIFAQNRKREQRTSRLWAVIGAALTLVVGWILSSINLASILHGIGQALGLVH